MFVIRLIVVYNLHLNAFDCELQIRLLLGDTINLTNSLITGI